jgi:asparagine synthase (glutamine-hydrolysing)
MSFHMVRSPRDAWALAGRPAVSPEALFAYLDADDPTIDDPLSRVTRLETALYMNSQLLRDTDAASMAHSLEVRVPLLDVDVAEFAFGLPAESKIGPPGPGEPATAKRVLLRAVGDLIPDWTWRKPKQGFTLPFGEWLRGPLRPLAEDAYGDPAFASLGWVDAAAARREWRRFLNDPSAHWSVVWTTLMLALWSRSAVAPAPDNESHDAMPLTVEGVH